MKKFGVDAEFPAAAREFADEAVEACSKPFDGEFGDFELFENAVTWPEGASEDAGDAPAAISAQDVEVAAVAAGRDVVCSVAIDEAFEDEIEDEGFDWLGSEGRAVVDATIAGDIAVRS